MMNKALGIRRGAASMPTALCITLMFLWMTSRILSKYCTDFGDASFVNAWTRQAASSDFRRVELAQAREPASAESSMGASFYCSRSAELQYLSQFVCAKIARCLRSHDLL
jgi:hypothetical protein